MICPHCHLPIPSAVKSSTKPTVNKKLAQDIKRAEAAIYVLDAAMHNPFFANIQPAIQSERDRLLRAMDAPRVLWAIYRRRDKGPLYYGLTDPIMSELNDMESEAA